MTQENNGEGKKWFRLSKHPTLKVDQNPLFPEMQPKKSFWSRRWWWPILGLLCLTIVVVMIIGIHANRFLQATNISWHEAYTLLQEVRETEIPSEGINILMFGIDETVEQREGSMLTDSIIVIHIDQNGSLDMVSIPRDLWIDSLKTKINALYYYGEISEATTGETLLSEVVSDITALKIDYYVVLNLEVVRNIIDAIGGIQLHVPRGFIDTAFPREKVDIRSGDSTALFERVEFLEGTQEMDGTRALKYIRSRQSADLDEGTDMARSERQQLVFESLIASLKTKQLWRYPELTGKLYRIFTDEVDTNLPLPILIRLGLATYNQATFEHHLIPTTDEDSENAVLSHPPVGKYNQWVYEPIDPSWNELRDYMSDLFSD